MEKIYYENQYIKEFVADIVNIKEIDNKFHIVLDKTAFFPGGGGQFSDTGIIENETVVNVYEENGVVYHILDIKPKKNQGLKCKIDWDKRQDGMHQHLAQHVISGCFYELFNQNTVSVHLGSDFSTVDIVGELDDEKVRKVEVYANELINNNLEVRSFVPTKQELHKFKLRRVLPKTNEEIRVVKIGDLDINACCGVHPNNTLDLRMIKIKRYEKHKGNTRIEFLAGKRAINDSLKKDLLYGDICRFLNSNEEETMNRIKNLNDDLKALIDENKKAKDQLSQYEIKEMIDNAHKIKDLTVISKVYENENAKYVNKVISKLVENENTIALMAIQSIDKVNLIFGCSKNIKNITMKDLLSDSITLIDGRGGGSNFLAQGGGKNNNNLESCIDYAINKIKREA